MNDTHTPGASEPWWIWLRDWLWAFRSQNAFRKHLWNKRARDSGEWTSYEEFVKWLDETQ